MGASMEFAAYRGTATAEEAYSELVSRATFEYGVDGYNGTISTSQGFYVASTALCSTYEAEALIAAEDGKGKLAKWSRWAAVPLCDGETSTIERAVTVTSPDRARIREAVMAKVPKDLAYAGHELNDVTVDYGATKTTLAKGARKMWVVHPSRGFSKAYETRAEATAAARQLLADQAFKASEPLRYFGSAETLKVRISQEFRTPDGDEAFTEMVREPRRLKGTARIWVCKRSTVRTGWMFGGWAAT